MRERAANERTSLEFSEVAAWRDVGAGWQPLFPSFHGAGFSIEWHDFIAKRELDWAASFHPACVELCLNLNGHGFVEGHGNRAEFLPNTAGFYHRKDEPLTAQRVANERHRFLTVEFSCPFLVRHLAGMETLLHPVVCAAVKQCPCQRVSGSTVRLTASQQQIVGTLRHPPVYAQAQPFWYQCKALELAATFLLEPPPEQELFCTRTQRAARERVERTRAILHSQMQNPPSLEELGRQVGCSPFYLSRQFSSETGLTTQQYIRQIRLERAAELLRTGQCNVTEAALEVGYNSLSHFTTAFRDEFGCCPGLYPVKMRSRQATPG